MRLLGDRIGRLKWMSLMRRIGRCDVMYKIQRMEGYVRHGKSGPDICDNGWNVRLSI